MKVVTVNLDSSETLPDLAWNLKIVIVPTISTWIYVSITVLQTLAMLLVRNTSAQRMTAPNASQLVHATAGCD